MAQYHFSQIVNIGAHSTLFYSLREIAIRDMVTMIEVIEGDEAKTINETDGAYNVFIVYTVQCTTRMV